jgi:hypothetical protein
MQLHTENNKLVTNLQSGARVFTIHASVKAFKLLSSNLYKYKVAAIIRELSCNALDSHIDAGNADPFIVHLPSELEPYFAVEDFGTGMTPDEIRDLYTGYFSSSKTERNDQIGALGLGSKSPFAYTDMFTIDSVKDGLKSTYSAFLDAEGMPTYMAVNAEATTQHSGVRITFPVPESDFSEFVREAATIFWAFNPEQRPLITGAVKRYGDWIKDFPKSTSSYEGNGWKIYKSYPSCVDNKYGYRNGAMVRMGNILYPIVSLASDPNFADVEAYVRNPLIIDMPLGACDINPGREELSYDKLTKDNIHQRLVSIHNELEKQASVTINSQETAWLAAKEAKKYFSGILKDRDDAKIQFTYKGKEYLYGQALSADENNLKVVYTSSRRGTYTIQVPTTQTLTKINMNLGGDYLIVLAGDKSLNSRYVRGRVKAYCEKNNMNETTIFLVRGISDASRAALAGVPVVPFNELPKLEYQQKTKSAGGIVVKYTDSTEMNIADVKGSKNIYVVDYKYSHALNGGFAEKDANLLSKKDRNLTRAMSYINEVDPSFKNDVYIVSSKTFSSLKLDSSKSWVSFEEAIKERIVPIYLAKVPIMESLIGERELLRFYGSLLETAANFSTADFAKDSPFRKAMNDLVGIRDRIKVSTPDFDSANKTMNHVAEALSRLHLSWLIPAKATGSGVVDTLKVYENYPLLAEFFSMDNSTYSLTRYTFHVALGVERTEVAADRPLQIYSIINYIKMVDKSNEII